MNRFKAISLLSFWFIAFFNQYFTVSAAEYSWPEDIPTPDIYFEQGDRFFIEGYINWGKETNSIMEKYETGVIISDPSGFEAEREVKCELSHGRCRVYAEDLFPSTTYKFTPYIIVDGTKYISNYSATRDTWGLMRDQNSQWNDYYHTHTTITVQQVKGNKHLQIWEGNEFVDVPESGYKIENLDPRPWFAGYFGEQDGIKRKFRLFIGDKSKIYDEILYTKMIKLELKCAESPTGFLLTSGYTPVDVEITGLKLQSDLFGERVVYGKISDSYWCGGLTPGKSYTFRLYAIVKSKVNGQEYLYPLRKYISVGNYTQDISFKTSSITFGEADTKGVSSSSSIITAATNIDERESGIGFQWKKYDAPSSLKPSEGAAVIRDGKIEGKLKNLQAQFYYNVRPFYKDQYGNYYFGEWITFDPSDFSYMEAIIHTYAPQDITSDKATLTGYVLEGSDDIIEQGFEYGPSDGTRTVRRVQSPLKSDRIVATGQIMSASLNDLQPNTDYVVRAYAITAEGEFFGEEQSFKTDTPAEISVIDGNGNNPVIVGYYSLTGQKLQYPQKGVNIVVYSNGVRKKIIFK